MKSFYLTGFMGAGKTTVAMKLGEKLQVPVFDIDQMIEETEGKTVANLFSQCGEEYFRSLETSMLQSINKLSVISTGGGIVKNKENRDWMREYGIVVFLDCDPDVIWERIQHDSTRPLVAGRKKEELVALYKERLPYYLDCHLRINTTSIAADQVVTRLAEEWKQKNLGIL